MRPRWIAGGVGGLAAVGAASLAWALAEAHWFTLRRVAVPVLPDGADPIKVLHLSDLHLVTRQHDKVAWVRALGDLEPDLVVVTGDLLADPGALEHLRFAFEPLLSRPGVFVFGSNDYYAPRFRNPLAYLIGNSGGGDEETDPLPADAVRSMLVRSGWLDLNNARGRAQVAGLDIAFVGTDDAHVDLDAMPPPVTDNEGAALRVAVTHAPYARVLRDFVADGADLVFAGHTHGGQVCVPGYGALVTNCDLDTGRVKGLSGWPGPRPDEPGGRDSVWLHVSAGLGTSPFAPIRFACRPEATLLTLVPRKV